MKNQPELLEQFLQALRQNPHALPPDGLDPELAEFARSLMQQTPSPSLNARRRMWERALAQSRVTSNGHLKELNTMAVITARPENLPRNNTRFPLTLLAAAFAALLFIAIYMMMPKGTPNFSMLSAPDSQQQETATAIPTIVPTSTPFPINLGGGMRGLGEIDTPGLPLSGALLLLGINAEAVQDVELTYQLTLNDGSVVYVHMQSIPANSEAVVIIRGMYPGVQVNSTDIATYEGHTFTVLVLDNGSTVFIDNLSPTMIVFTTDPIGTASVIPVVIPSEDNPSDPSLANPIQATVVPMDLQPTVLPPSVIIVTATPIPAMVVTATIVPTAVP